MPSCDFCKCCVRLWCCKFFDTVGIKSEGVNVRKKARRNAVRKNPAKGKRGSIFSKRRGTEDDIESRRTLLREKITLKYEPNNGIVWNTFHWMGRWLFSASIASFLIWALSLVFLRIHLDNYNTKCDLKTEFILYEGEIKQVWSSGKNQTLYGNECLLDTNPIIMNVTGILIFLLTLALGAGLNKYKETLRLYEEIAGDIKAMAMLLVHLTFDSEKYHLKKKKLEWKTNVEATYRKMKYLLSSLAPTVKNTIAGGEYTVQYRPGKWSCPRIECTHNLFLWSNPFDALSDRKYFEVKQQGVCNRLFFSSTVEYPNYWKHAAYQLENAGYFKKLRRGIRVTQGYEDVTLADIAAEVQRNPPFELGKQTSDRTRLFELIEQAGGELNAEVQHSLYKKITDIHEFTEMDAFECSMTVLMDEVMRLFENGLGFGVDEGSAVASAAIDRWNAIYGTWGTLSSLKTFSEPLIVNIFRAVLIGIYAWFMPKTYLKYSGVIEESWLFIFVGSDMLVFCLMWWLAFAVRNPFKNSFIIRNVSKLAYQTQFQVQQLMANQLEFDKVDYSSNSEYGYITKPGHPTNPATIGIDIFGPDPRPIEDILADSLKVRNEKAATNQQELNMIIARALKLLNQETIDRDKRLEKIVGDILTAVLPPEDVSGGDISPSVRRRRGLNF